MVSGACNATTARMTGVSKTTILKLIVDLGSACRAYHDANVRGLETRRLQADELWAFCYAREKNVPEALRGMLGYGDVWTWTAIDADTKLIVGYHVGHRDVPDAHALMSDVAGRLSGRVQLTSDGLNAYWHAVALAFDCEVDYAMLSSRRTAAIRRCRSASTPRRFARVAPRPAASATRTWRTSARPSSRDQTSRSGCSRAGTRA